MNYLSRIQLFRKGNPREEPRYFDNTLPRNSKYVNSN